MSAFEKTVEVGNNAVTSVFGKSSAAVETLKKLAQPATSSEDQVVKKNYPDGSVYTGNMKDGQRHGSGMLMLSEGEFYIGEWRNDKREGKGAQVIKAADYFDDVPQETHYEGEWHQD